MLDETGEMQVSVEFLEQLKVKLEADLHKLELRYASFYPQQVDDVGDMRHILEKYVNESAQNELL